MRMRIQPWPFKKGEEVELYWLCSPFLDMQKGWMLEATFKTIRNEIVDIAVPWGTIPYLIIGQKYMDGLPSPTGKCGEITQIAIQESNLFEIGKAYDIPFSLYYFYKNQKYGFQQICKFKVGDRNYYIPCLEIIRNFLTPHKVLANCIMKPGGLDLLISRCKITGRDLFMELSDEIKGNLVCNETACYLAWLKYDYYANNAWNSIYNTFYSNAIKLNAYNPNTELQKGTYLEVKPPIGKGTRLTCRGINVGKDTLILEILSKTNLNMPFDKINYTHSSLKNIELMDRDKQVRIIKNEVAKDVVNMDKSGEGANKNYNEQVIDNISIGFSFIKTPRINKVRKKKQSINTGEPDNAGILRSFETTGEDEVMATTQDWVYGGNINPLEFKTLEIMKEGATKGLEDFLKVVGYINELYKGLKLSLNIVLLPKGKAFSYYPDGERRNCAVVKIEGKNELHCYIIEVGRADGWSISTFIIYPLSLKVNQAFEELLHKILINLINNSGHWDKQSLENEIYIRYDMVKHVSCQKIWTWKERIYNKLLIF